MEVLRGNQQTITTLSNPRLYGNLPARFFSWIHHVRHLELWHLRPRLHFLLALFCVFQSVAADASTSASTNTASGELVYSRTAGHATITVGAIGDIMLGTDYPYDRLPEDDGDFLLADVTSFLVQADITIGNLEGVLMEDDHYPSKQCDDKSSCFAFRSPPHYAQHLRNAGISAVSLANNHSFDFGRQGFIESKIHLAANGIQTSGGKGDFAMWPDREVRTAMVAFSTYDHTNNMNDLDNASRIMSQLSQFFDVVIVSFHGGAEGRDKSRLPFATEYYQGENRGDVVSFSRAMIDAGADLVIGHGPHVPRAMELYKRRLIAYSLGNFATHEGILIDDQLGYAPILLATMSGNGEFLCGQIVSARQSRENGVQPDKDQLAYKEIRKRTNEDLSGGGLSFSNDGFFNRTDTSESLCH